MPTISTKNQKQYFLFFILLKTFLFFTIVNSFDENSDYKIVKKNYLECFVEKKNSEKNPLRFEIYEFNDSEKLKLIFIQWIKINKKVEKPIIMLLGKKLIKQYKSLKCFTIEKKKIERAILQRNKQKIHSAYPQPIHFKCPSFGNKSEYGCEKEHHFELYCNNTKASDKCSNNFYIMEVAITSSEKSFEYIYETECPCGYERIPLGNGLDEYKNHKSFEVENFDTKRVINFTGAKECIFTSGVSKNQNNI
uniref:Phlebovirus glycoprotein G2 fusion domain-containing protein n=1 Tax=Meloidogyne hapla TaxID=6305 RepID=A0A1I8BKN0_MELHA